MPESDLIPPAEGRPEAKAGPPADGGPAADPAAGPFHDLARYLALPRAAGLAVSPDGSRLVTTVTSPAPDGKKYVTALWELDPAGERPARRLTRSAPGESQPVFQPDGGLLFTSKRPDVSSVTEDEDEAPALWLLPPAGEPRQVAGWPGGVGQVAVATGSGDVVFTAAVLPGATTAGEDRQLRTGRRDAGVTAILHEGFPVRLWDHDLGPDQARVFAGGALRGTEARLDDARDLTPDPRGQVKDGLAVTPDGRVVAVWWQLTDGGPTSVRDGIALLETATGKQKQLVEQPDHSFSEPAFSPDGRYLICVREYLGTVDGVPEGSLRLVDLDSGDERDLLTDDPLWPRSPVFSPDGESVFFAADQFGRSPVFRLDLATATVTRLTAAGSYTDLVVAPDGAAVYALRSAVDEPPAPVRLDPRAGDQDPRPLPAPTAVEAGVPGSLTEMHATAADGTPLRAWLALPAGASGQAPAPLLLWVHGGPLASWNAWSWRWNPWLLVARGYAVLLPDPALSTGYGREFVRRGRGRWGGPPFTDLMTMTDVTCERADIDRTRTAVMGGSFGGYMANWIATRTDRFRAIVTHASLWHLDGFLGTTDDPEYWLREFGDPLTDPERYTANSPHLRVADIRTPMLVIHGDRDYRVPIGEALRLWYDLRRFDVPAKFLYFPDENHWVLTPGHARVWYETVFAFLAEHVLDEPWRQPDLL